MPFSRRQIIAVIAVVLLSLAGAALRRSAPPPLDINDPYAIVHDDEHATYQRTHLPDANEVEALHARYPGKFIWFREWESEKSYIVRDPATLAKVEAVWVVVDKLNSIPPGSEQQMIASMKQIQHETEIADAATIKLVQAAQAAGLARKVSSSQIAGTH